MRVGKGNRRRRSVSSSVGDVVADYRHGGYSRVNIPFAGAFVYEAGVRDRRRYAYDPHLDPQLVWAGKAGLRGIEWDEGEMSFEVDVVPLHIHERVVPRDVILSLSRGAPVQTHLFEPFDLPLEKQLDFYRHEMGWTNRLVLGDSLLVMNSLLVKEGMAGKVQMIYIDPPYGIKYSSNFQPRIDKRDVKDVDEDLTREPEQIKAYRDTWELGIHSWLSYLRDRLLLCKELLSESGSIFLQINDENLHLAKCLLDEIFGRENFVALIPFTKTRAVFEARTIRSICDYLVWYAKDKTKLKYRPLYVYKDWRHELNVYTYIIYEDGSIKSISKNIINDIQRALQEGAHLFKSDDLIRPTNPEFDFKFQDREFRGRWRTNQEGMRRLAMASRLFSTSNQLRYIYLFDDFPVKVIENIWLDTIGESEKIYSVQTNAKVVERCILMTTDPGDLVFDPTCGSGTTAYAAEKWGRRWITCDTSRVAIAIARQRLMTAKYDYYELRDPEKGPAGGFIYETVPHITLESIAKNTKIDEIAEKYNPKIQQALTQLNNTLKKNWKEWEIPRNAEKDWPHAAKMWHSEFWRLKTEKKKEIDRVIRENAPQEVLYDKPKIDRNKIRVSGPFTVEAITPPTEIANNGQRTGTDYISMLIELLKKTGGIHFNSSKKLTLNNIRQINIELLHAEAETPQNSNNLKVAISFGPQYGAVNAYQVIEATRTAIRAGYDILIIAGFSFTDEAQKIAEKPVQKLKVHLAYMSPDILMQDLLKTTKTSQIFTVFGQPDVDIKKQKDDSIMIELKGVDFYDPIEGKVLPQKPDKIPAWFIDTDYDGMTFVIRQAFFPANDNTWKKLQRALRAYINEQIFEQMKGTKSFPFQPGEHKQVAIKVIDLRGNESMKVIALG
jgi:adenine-specific DNA-methyltransferase